MSLLAAGAIAAPVIGGLIGSSAASDAASDAAEARKQALAALQAVELPDIEKMKLAMEMPEYFGDYTPELEQQILSGPSAMEGIEVDPRLAQAQMSALGELQRQGSEGLSESDMAMLRQGRRMAAGEAQAKQGQILQSMAQRGIGGSGAELAARMGASQQSADRMAQESDRLAQMQQEARRNALMQAGQLGGSIRGQSFGEQSQVAGAQDVMDRFNVQNQIGSQQRNVSSQNAARLRNLEQQQRLSEVATSTRNMQQQYNKNLQQQRFENEIRKAGGVASQYGQQAQDFSRQGQAAGQMWSNIGSGVGGGLASVYGATSKTTPSNAASEEDVEKYW